MTSVPSEFVTEQNVRTVLRSYFNLEVVKSSRMDSYYNFNFLVKCKKPGEISTQEQRFIVKIFNTKSPSFFDNPELQLIMMSCLKANNFMSSTPLATVEGETSVRHREGDKDYLLQVLTFVPGQSVNETKLNADEMMEVCFQVGKSLATLSRITSTMQYDFSTSTPDFPWLPQNAMNFFDKLHYVKNEDVRRVIANYKQSYESGFLPRLKELRKGFVHGDSSDTNILVAKTQSDGWAFSGIIDFEHCHFGYLVGELGVSIAYSMMKSVSIPGADVIALSRQQILGYHSVNPLTKAEMEVLFDVVIGRLCSSYISASYEVQQHPENEKYIFTSAHAIPLVFKALDEAGRKTINQTWFGDLIDG